MNEAAAVSSQDRRVSSCVFISYATADRKEAMRLCKAIERRGTQCWISTRDVALGENYQEAIVHSIRSARAIVLVFSEAANGSDEIKKELSLASRYHVPVMAVRIEEVEPSDAFAYELSTRQWIDAFAGWDRSIDILVRRISELPVTQAHPASGSDATVRRRSLTVLPRRARAAAAGLLLLAAAGAAFWYRHPAPISQGMTVRLGGFQRLSADLPATLPDAIRDEIIAAFNDQGGIAVSTASSPAPGSAPAYELGGTVRRDGQHIRVISRLTNERSGTTLWSDSFDYDSDELPRVPRLVALDSGNMIRCGLDAASTYSKFLPDPVMADYMQFCQNSWSQTNSDSGKALDSARRVVAAAPDFSWGWSAITRVAAAQDFGPHNAEVREEGLRAANTALAIDPTNSEALAWQAELIDPRDWIGQETLFKRALAARPLACGCEHYLYGYFLQGVGRFADAAAEFRRSTEMLALNRYTQFALADSLSAIGKADDAKPHFAAAIELMPARDFADRIAILEAPESGDYSAGIKALNDPRHFVVAQRKAALLDAYRAMISNKREAKAQAIKSLLALPDEEKGSLVMRLVAALGDDHDAFQIFINGYRAGDVASSDLWYPSMRRVLDDPGFAAVAARIGLMRYWRATHIKPDICSAKRPPNFCRSI